MKNNVLEIATGLPASIGLALAEHPALAGMIGGWLIYRYLKNLKCHLENQ